MSHPANEHFYETALEAQERRKDFRQEAQITLSRKTLELLLDDHWTLTKQENRQVKEALRAMRLNDKLEPLKPVWPKQGPNILHMVD